MILCRAAALSGLLGLAACATPPVVEDTPPTPLPEAAQVSTHQDCAVFAAIAREHYRFADNPPPPLWASVEEEGGGRYLVDCDWPRLGVPMSGEIFDPDAPAPDRLRWVKFERPVYQFQEARVRTGILHGPLAGMGYECVVVSGIAGWTVSECRSTWVS